MKKILSYICLCTASMLLFTGCGQNNAGSDISGNNRAYNNTGENTTDTVNLSDSQNPEDNAEALVIHGIFLKEKNDTWLFADEQTSTPFTAPIPDDLTDTDGNVITKDQLKPGNKIDIYGNGIMLQSYPAQYPGVTKMILTDKGAPENIKPFENVIDQYFADPDLSEPPALDISYSTNLGNITALLSGPGNYTWSVSDENGKANELTACGPHILQWPNLAEMNIDGTTDMQLAGEVLPEKVVVTRWPDSLYMSENTDDAGENVEVHTTENGEIYLSGIEPGYIYGITASWEMGSAEYAFITK
ncbi:MAG: hypothetical protein SOZ97_11275 [Lachnospiraceae bacterium]|nr:hypothetical protein [Lachnospiraceae bacterium]